jgi:hypothetical protein
MQPDHGSMGRYHSSHSDPLWVVLGTLYRYAGAPTGDSGRRSALKPCTQAVFERFAP